MDEAFPQLPPRYRVERVLGEGGVSNVYLAYDSKFNRKVAVKVLKIQNDNIDVRNRFQMEARAIAELQHPNIVHMYDYSDPDTTPFYQVMEYLPGKPLDVLLDENGPFSEQTALCIGLGVAQAVAYAHERNVIHRDIKPGNVMLHDGKVKLLDFGAIKVLVANQTLGVEKATDTTIAIGTPGFMAPEQYRGKAIDARTDIYAFGVLLYNLVTNSLPQEGIDEHDFERLYTATIRGRNRDPRFYQPFLSAGFCALVDDCINPSPARRLQDMLAVIERIELLAAHHGITDTTAELEAFSRSPEKTEELQQRRSSGQIEHELEHALLRELLTAVKHQREDQIRVLLARLETIATSETLRRAGLPAATVNLFTKTQRRARWRWLLVGLLGGLLLGAAAFYAALHFDALVFAFFS
jgi:serine/threonine protein kinase